MTTDKTSATEIVVRIDPHNPGHFFACCGLFEVAHRLWDDTRAFFDDQNRFTIQTSTADASLAALLETVRSAQIRALSVDEDRELLQLLSANSPRKRTGSAPTGNESKQRKKELLDRQRSLPLYVSVQSSGIAFVLRLDWWIEDDDAPKTWAGTQDPCKIARAAQASLAQAIAKPSPLDYACHMLETWPELETTERISTENERRNAAKETKKKKKPSTVMPFYLDARQAATKIDAGFSLDVIPATPVAYPVVELLALIGLQRFRPAISNRSDRTYYYQLWTQPLSAVVAPAVSQGVVRTPGTTRYRFPLQFRDDQKRYKAVGLATKMADEQGENS